MTELKDGKRYQLTIKRPGSTREIDGIVRAFVRDGDWRYEVTGFVHDIPDVDTSAPEYEIPGPREATVGIDLEQVVSSREL